MTEAIDFAPDWVSPPGETITQFLRQHKVSIAEFATRIGQTQEITDDLISGRLPLTFEIAERLETAIGSSVNFWMAREIQYRRAVGKIQRENADKESRVWLNEIPIGDMRRFGWVETYGKAEEQIAACLRFFGVATIDAWRQEYGGAVSAAAFRTSLTFASQPGALAAWLREGELKGGHAECERWDEKKFVAVLRDIRPLTREKDVNVLIPILQEKCAECGVAVVILRAPSGCRASGATRFLTSTRALILLSFRYLSDDHFWFTFFHEAGHLLLHGKEKLFLEGLDLISTQEEKEANEFSANVLIPIEYQEELSRLPVDGRAVMRFARKVGISPGVVVGQMQHKVLLTQRQLNNLKRRYRWRDN